MWLKGPERDLTRSERWTAGIFAVLVAGLFALDVAIDFSPAKLSILFFLLFWVPLLCIHEAGHALVAVVLGWRVHRVVIGIGPIVKRFSVGRTEVELRSLPLEGFTRLEPRRSSMPGLRSFLIYAAGPGFEVAVLGLIAVLTGTETLLSHSDSIPIIAAQSLSVAIMLSVVTNLIPHSVESRRGLSPNDGLGMLLSFSLTESRVDEIVAELEQSREKK